ncbi:MAG: M48 family metallopeptidase [Candidatus Diapherotrites archaeon]|nr:M48 family metallopeptidase [Candidatus Diapherotrites archaeon]
MTSEIVFPYEFDSEKRKKSKIYLKQKLITGLLNGFVVPLIFLVWMIFSGFGLALEQFAFSLSSVFGIPIFVFLFLTLTELVEFPLGFYSSYIFEHKYHLSNYSLKGWFKDFFKGLLLSYVIGIPLMSLVFFFISNFSNWWILAWLVLTVFSVFMAFIYPVIIFPFFYKTQPYQDQEQVQALLAMVQKAGVKNIDRVLLAKESEKSKKPNAMFAGMGKTKTIVLFDTLTESFTFDETQTVVAHELGHYVFKDNYRFIVLEAAALLPTLYVINLVLQSSFVWFGIPIISLVIIPVFVLTSLVIEFFSGPIIQAYSRHRELSADIFALDLVEKPLAQISTEKRLADMSLADHNPNKWIEILFFSHPSSQKRIDACYAWAKEHNLKLDK